MKIVVVYVYPFNGRDGRRSNAERFVWSYLNFDPGVDHEFIAVCNGESASPDTVSLFEAIPNLRFLDHDNSGYDIGAFQHAARDIPADLMVFFGNSAYLRLDLWLKRMVEVYKENGNKLYGSMQNSGNPAVGVWPHIRTTGFWMNPGLLLQYPIQVCRPEQRYPFEHGSECLTSFCKKKSGVLSVTYDGIYPIHQWRRVPEGYHNGSQAAMLTGDRMSCPPYYHAS